MIGWEALTSRQLADSRSRLIKMLRRLQKSNRHPIHRHVVVVKFLFIKRMVFILKKGEHNIDYLLCHSGMVFGLIATVGLVVASVVGLILLAGSCSSIRPDRRTTASLRLRSSKHATQVGRSPVRSTSKPAGFRQHRSVCNVGGQDICPRDSNV